MIMRNIAIDISHMIHTVETTIVSTLQCSHDLTDRLVPLLLIIEDVWDDDDIGAADSISVIDCDYRCDTDYDDDANDDENSYVMMTITMIINNILYNTFCYFIIIAMLVRTFFM